MLVTIGRYLNLIEAHIVRGRIEAEGISAYVQHEHHIWAKWTLSVALGFVKIQVRAEDAVASASIVERFHAGEFSLEDDEQEVNGICPGCGCESKERVAWSTRLALFMFLLFSLAVPYTNHRMKCIECNHIWTQKEQRGYPLWVLALAILVGGLGFFVSANVIYYICGIIA